MVVAYLVLIIPVIAIIHWTTGTSIEGALTVPAAVGALLLVVYENFGGSTPPPTTLNTRLGKVRDSLRQTGEMLSAIDEELATRLAALEESQSRLERYEQLSTLTPDQRNAIDAFFDQRFEREGRQSRRRDLMLFSLGLLFAIPVGFVVNWASAPLWHLLTK